MFSVHAFPIFVTEMLKIYHISNPFRLTQHRFWCFWNYAAVFSDFILFLNVCQNQIFCEINKHRFSIVQLVPHNGTWCRLKILHFAFMVSSFFLILCLLNMNNRQTQLFRNKQTTVLNKTRISLNAFVCIS